MLRTSVIILISFSVSILSFCSDPSKYDRAKELITEAKLKYGNDFFRKKQFDDAFKILQSIPPSSKDYKSAQELIEQIKEERLSIRRQNVRKMLQAGKKQKKLMQDQKTDD